MRLLKKYVSLRPAPLSSILLVFFIILDVSDLSPFDNRTLQRTLAVYDGKKAQILEKLDTGRTFLTLLPDSC